MKLNKKKKGFTLIELMAVIAIVAILAAVLVPTVSGYIMRARKSGVVTQIRNAANAIGAYNVTNDSPLTTDTLSNLVCKKSEVEGEGNSGKKLSKAELLYKEDVDLLIKATNTAETKDKLTAQQIIDLSKKDDLINRITMTKNGSVYTVTIKTN